MLKNKTDSLFALLNHLEAISHGFKLRIYHNHLNCVIYRFLGIMYAHILKNIYMFRCGGFDAKDV